jgi:hypothetical protein
MSISLFDATIPSFIQILTSVEGFLAKGLAHFKANNIDPESIVETSVYPDMFPFRFQVTSSVSHSIGAIEGVRKGVYTPSPPSTVDYAGLQALVRDGLVALKSVTAEEINAFQGKDMRFEFRERNIPFTAENFLLSFFLPNFYFHSSMAYGILRAQGVPLGKRDFMGQLRIKH